MHSVEKKNEDLSEPRAEYQTVSGVHTKGDAPTLFGLVLSPYFLIDNYLINHACSPHTIRANYSRVCFVLCVHCRWIQCTLSYRRSPPSTCPCPSCSMCTFESCSWPNDSRARSNKWSNPCNRMATWPRVATAKRTVHRKSRRIPRWRCTIKCSLRITPRSPRPIWRQPRQWPCPPFWLLPPLRTDRRRPPPPLTIIPFILDRWSTWTVARVHACNHRSAWMASLRWPTAWQPTIRSSSINDMRKGICEDAPDNS